MENILNGHRDSDTGKEFIYTQGIIPIMFILCESDGKFNDRCCLYSAKHCHTRTFKACSACTQFLALCWALFIIGWCDGSTGPLLPRIQEFYHIGSLHCIGSSDSRNAYTVSDHLSSRGPLNPRIRYQMRKYALPVIIGLQYIRD